MHELKAGNTMNEQQHEKVLAALEHIENAQRLALRAAEELCSVDGMAGEWVATGDLYDTIKRHWHRVDHARVALRRMADPPEPDAPAVDEVPAVPLDPDAPPAGASASDDEHWLVLALDKSPRDGRVAWWCPNGRGYTTEITDAGVHSRDEIAANLARYFETGESVPVSLRQVAVICGRRRGALAHNPDMVRFFERSAREQFRSSEADAA